MNPFRGLLACLEARSKGLCLAVLLALQSALMPSRSAALEVDGMSFPDEYVLDGQKLVVNGGGTRLYSWLKVKVYSGVLYASTRSSDAQTLIQTKTPRVLFVKMRVDSKRSDAVEAWRYYLEHNCSKPCTVASNRWTPFLEAMADLKEGDTEAYIFTGSGFELRRNERSVVKISDAELASLILAGWLGQEPTTPELKKALLGRH